MSAIFKALQAMLCMASISLLLGGPAAHAESSAQPIKIILPTPAGIGPDLWIRKVIPLIAQQLRQPVVLENKPGGNGIIGASSVLNAAPDGGTLLFTSVAELLAAKYLNPAAQITPDRLTPVTAAIKPQLFLVASPALPIKSLAELGGYAQSISKPITYGTSGVGSPFHLAGISLAQSSKAALTHVPYKGTLLAIQDVIGGRIDMGFGSLAGVSQFIQKGQLKPLVVLANQRSKAFPAVPTIFEAVPNI